MSDKDGLPATPKHKPLPEDYEVAEKESPDWSYLTTRQRNARAKDQMYHREFALLCEAIRGGRTWTP